MGNEITSVTTANGTYTVGMTREQAEQQGMYKTKTGIDFIDLDTDNSNDLSLPEILSGVKKQTKRNRYKYGIGTILLGIGTGICAIGTPFTGGTSATGAGLLGMATGAAIIAAINAEEQYEEADRQLSELDVKY